MNNKKSLGGLNFQGIEASVEDEDIEEAIEIMEVGKQQHSAREIEEDDILEEVGYEEDFVDEDDVEKLID